MGTFEPPSVLYKNRKHTKVTKEGACFGLVTAPKAPKVFSSRWHPYHAERAHAILSRDTTESVTQRGTMLTGFPIRLGVNRRNYAV